MIFRVGQSVVCVKVGKEYRDWCNLPRVGVTYTISWTGTDDVRLAEIKNMQCWCLSTDSGQIVFEEPSFYAEWFRPIAKRKTDIGVLTALLDSANRKELVDG